ncbi:dehydratase [Virgibacillus halodenitrificans]|uniref:Dehydratase n=1 Tax=Virgibacillus halodenitrificans TaxID=1482 RepID=A0AAC9NLD7_VIRHA|nr:MaoC family dehydratase N-terminal domain-containing protein [Virgibacillus halodenitrificans]APC48880.1 dehydratase [Virgibacillus halodenitrificans]
MELDNSIIGMTGESFTFEVEKGHIKRFAEAIGDNNPLYINQEYAEKTTYQSVIAPPTFLIAAGANGGDLPLELDTKRMLHGEQEFIYYKSVRPGDSLQCQMKVSDLYEREGKSGSMQFLILDTEMKDPQGELVAISRMNIIYRKI